MRVAFGKAETGNRARWRYAYMLTAARGGINGAQPANAYPSRRRRDTPALAGDSCVYINNSEKYKATNKMNLPLCVAAAVMAN